LINPEINKSNIVLFFIVGKSALFAGSTGAETEHLSLMLSNSAVDKLADQTIGASIAEHSALCVVVSHSTVYEA
jgi:hypothetical protein